MFNPYLKEIDLNTSKTIDEFRFENTDLTVPEFMAKINFLLTEGKGYYEKISFAENTPCSVKLHCLRSATPAEVSLAKDLQVTVCLDQINTDLQVLEQRLRRLNSDVDYIVAGAVLSRHRSPLGSWEVTPEQVEAAKLKTISEIAKVKAVKDQGATAVVELMVNNYGRHYPWFTKIVVDN